MGCSPSDEIMKKATVVIFITSFILLFLPLINNAQNNVTVVVEPCPQIVGTCDRTVDGVNFVPIGYVYLPQTVAMTADGKPYCQPAFHSLASRGIGLCAAYYPTFCAQDNSLFTTFQYCVLRIRAAVRTNPVYQYE